MGWFRRRDRKPDRQLADLHREADASLAEARLQRDVQRRKLRDEDRSLVQPMVRIRESNHFADLIRATLQGGKGERA